MRSTTMIAVIACMVSLAKGAPPPPGGVQGYQKRGDERLEQIKQDRVMKTRLDRANDDRDQPEDEVKLSCASKACTYDAYLPEGNTKGLLQLTPRPIKKDGKTFIAFEQNEDIVEFDTLTDYGYFGGVKSFANVRSFTNDKFPKSAYNVEIGARGKIPNAMVTCSWTNTECDYAAKPTIITGPKRTVVKYPIVGAGTPNRLLGGDHERRDHERRDHERKEHERKHHNDARQIRNKQGL
eukprot:GHVU01228361.1.p1 GENE.GHVU01228361.1~~GHVU01228361.1.p1  ORF type:complete len:238 (+),score=32.90 GHVU01228361.1:87-800(+)